MNKRINTGGTMITERQVGKDRARQLSNAHPIFEPGCIDAHSQFFTLDPGKAWVVNLIDANLAGNATIKVLRHSMLHRAPCSAENVHDKDDMFDFIRTNGYQVMNLGGKDWELNKDQRLLIICLPGTYSFVCDSVEALETLSLNYEEFKADELLPYLPKEYLGGI